MSLRVVVAAVLRSAAAFSATPAAAGAVARLSIAAAVGGLLFRTRGAQILLLLDAGMPEHALLRCGSDAARLMLIVVANVLLLLLVVVVLPHGGEAAAGAAWLN